MAVSVQAVGTLLLALILAQLGRISVYPYARQWALAWGTMFLALFSVRLYIYTHQPVFWIPYLLLEWAFLALLWSGSRSLVRLPEIDERLMVYVVPVAVVAAAVMTKIAPTFDDLFSVQAAIVSISAAQSFRVLSRAPVDRRLKGWFAIRWALIAMTVLYAAYVPLYAINDHVFKVPVLAFSSLADLMVCILLGFGMVLVTAEEANVDLRHALEELSEARNILAKKLNIDPLTDALNRHAFHSMQKGEDVAAESLSGVVIMIDIDSLKQINDSDGHSAGDAVIRAAANSIRGIIRADDLLFRWGGDEFVAIVPNSTMATVEERLEPLSHPIVVDHGREISFRLSWGSAEFGPNRPLEAAMKLADERMYESRGGKAKSQS